MVTAKNTGNGQGLSRGPGRRSAEMRKQPMFSSVVETNVPDLNYDLVEIRDTTPVKNEPAG